MSIEHRLVAAVVIASIVPFGALGPAVHAASGTYTAPTGCKITYQNTWSASQNQATAKSTKVSGTTTYSIEANFVYYDSNTGTYKNTSTGWSTASSVTATAYTNVKPSSGSWHGCNATAGGAKWSANYAF